MGNRTTLAPAPPRVSGLRDYRTLTLPAIPKPSRDPLERAFRRYDPREDAADPELRDVYADDGSTLTPGARGPGHLPVPQRYGTARTGPARLAPGADATSAEQRALPVVLRRTARIVIPVARPTHPMPARWRTRARDGRAGAGQGVRRMVADGLARHAHQRSFWLVTNLAILVVAGLAIAIPQLVTADAAAACSWHTVVPGDTLGNLGWKNHTNALALASANHIANPNRIYVGQRLCIPQTSWAQASSAPAVPAAPPRQVFNGQGVKGEPAFVQLALPYAQSAHQQCNWPVSVILAQWGIEEGWQVPTYTGYNFGNVSAITGQPSVKGLNVPGSPTAFAYAATPDKGLQYYVIYCHMGYYSGVAPAGASGGPDAAARALGRSPWDAGHYTATNSPGSSLLTAMRVFNLYYYDKPSQPAAPSNPAPAPPAQPIAGVGLAPEPCDSHIPSWVWTQVNYHKPWTVPPGCYAGVFTVNPANYVRRSGYGWCNWWPEVLRPDQPQLPWGAGLTHSSTPRVGATVFFAPFDQGASREGHFAHVEAISPDGQWVLVSEMNNYWRGAGFAKVNYRFVHVEPGVTFIY
jgi:LysM repeat protein